MAGRDCEVCRAQLSERVLRHCRGIGIRYDRGYWIHSSKCAALVRSVYVARRIGCAAVLLLADFSITIRDSCTVPVVSRAYGRHYNTVHGAITCHRDRATSAETYEPTLQLLSTSLRSDGRCGVDCAGCHHYFGQRWTRIIRITYWSRWLQYREQSPHVISRI